MNQQHEDVENLGELNMMIKSTLETYLKSRYVFQYYKPWTGHNFKTGKTKCFYDEREWRYVPIQNNGFESIFNDDEEFRRRMHEYYERLIDPVLVFEPKDIRYLIVEREEERFDLVQTVRAVKRRFSSEDVETLVSRIITAEQIEHDL